MSLFWLGLLEPVNAHRLTVGGQQFLKLGHPFKFVSLKSLGFTSTSVQAVQWGFNSSHSLRGLTVSSIFITGKPRWKDSSRCSAPRAGGAWNAVVVAWEMLPGF